VAVAQHRRQAVALVALRDQERPTMRERVGQDLGRVAHALERRRDLLLEIDTEMRPALRHLAFGLERHAPGEVVAERAGIEVLLGARNRGLTGHAAAPLVLLL